jgi:hypothetical protein
VVDQDRLFVGCGEASWLELEEVQLEGKKRMAAADFLRGHASQLGDRLGDAQATGSREQGAGEAISDQRSAFRKNK